MPISKTKWGYLIAGGLILAIILFFACSNSVCHKKPTVNSAQLLIKDSVSWPKLSADNQKILYFNEQQQTIKSVTIKNKKITTIIDQPLGKAYFVNWSPTDDKVIIGTSSINAAGIYELKVSLIDLNTKIIKVFSAPLPENIAWSPDGQKIVYSYISSQNADLTVINIAEPDGENSQEESQLNTYGASLQLFWLDENMIKIFKAYDNPPESFDLTDYQKRSVLYRFDTSNQSLNKENISENLTEIKYAYNAQQFIALTTGEQNSASINKTSGEKENFQPQISSLSSSVWSTDSQSVFSIMPNAENSISLYQTKSDNNSPNKLADFTLPKMTVDNNLFIDNLLISDNNKNIYFTINNLLFYYILPDKYE
jgi:dipeptidyl aminopeptidase/acylaminoacyl peptidase